MSTYTNVAIYGASSYTSAQARSSLLKDLQDMTYYNNLSSSTTRPTGSDTTKNSTATMSRHTDDERTLYGDDTASIRSTSTMSSLKTLLRKKPTKNGKPSEGTTAESQNPKTKAKLEEQQRRRKEANAMAASTYLSLR